MTPTYIPRHGTLADRVLEWFRKNPEEELSRADVSMKFEVPQSSVQACLQAAVDAGELVWTKLNGHSGVYTYGGRQGAPTTTEVLPVIKAKPSAEPAPASAWRTSAATDDLYATVNADRRIHIAFTLPPDADANLVMAAMLIAAATSLGARA